MRGDEGKRTRREKGGERGRAKKKGGSERQRDRTRLWKVSLRQRGRRGEAWKGSHVA